MKYISYLIFFLFIGLLILFLKNALEPAKEDITITGSEKCGECHSLKNLGDQNKVWKNSGHSGAYTVLFSTKAIEFNRNNSLNAPDKEDKCLKCHSTLHFLQGTIPGENFDIKEGIGCEACHGAGSLYSPAQIMKDEDAFIKAGGVKGDEQTCLKCHSVKRNRNSELKDNICPFQLNDFNYNIEFEKIKHPVNREMVK